MNTDEIHSQEAVSEYLDSRYPEEGMKGHRQQLYAAAFDIAQYIVNGREVSNPRDGMIMRRAWECSRAGQSNFACSALGDALGGFDRAYWEHVAYMLTIPGFLTKKERWHSARRSGVTVYRGCSESEIQAQELGYSWTLDREVAAWFAQVHHGKILTVTFSPSLSDGAWLDTAESEIIWPVGWDDVQDMLVEDAPEHTTAMQWDKRRHITPLQAKRAA